VKTKLRIDAVRLMREIRDEISREIAGMDYQKQKQYIRNHLERERSGVKEKKRTTSPY
jgi:ribosomal protein L22